MTLTVITGRVFVVYVTRKACELRQETIARRGYARAAMHTGGYEFE